MRNDFESNYLMHHGILGQKWGHKNGPPYPLGASDHSASEKKAGWRASLADRALAKVSKKKRRELEIKEHKQRIEDFKKKDINEQNKEMGQKVQEIYSHYPDYLENSKAREKAKKELQGDLDEVEKTTKEWLDAKEAFWKDEKTWKAVAKDAEQDDRAKWVSEDTPKEEIKANKEYWINEGDSHDYTEQAILKYYMKTPQGRQMKNTYEASMDSLHNYINDSQKVIDGILKENGTKHPGNSNTDLSSMLSSSLFNEVEINLDREQRYWYLDSDYNNRFNLPVNSRKNGLEKYHESGDPHWDVKTARDKNKQNPLTSKIEKSDYLGNQLYRAHQNTIDSKEFKEWNKKQKWDDDDISSQASVYEKSHPNDELHKKAQEREKLEKEISDEVWRRRAKKRK